MSKLSNKRLITLPNSDNTLEIVMTDEFLNKIRERFDLSKNASVDDDQIRMFIWGACNSAITKAEEQSVVMKDLKGDL